MKKTKSVLCWTAMTSKGELLPSYVSKVKRLVYNDISFHWADDPPRPTVVRVKISRVVRKRKKEAGK